MGFDFQSHIPIVREGQLLGYSLDPYALIVTAELSLAIQGGRFWGYNGSEFPVEDLPDFVWDTIAGYSDDYRKQLGIDKLVRPVSKAAKKVATDGSGRP